MWVDKGERRLVDVEGVVDKRVLGELRIDAVYLAVFLRIIEVKLYIPAEGRKSVGINYYDRIESTHPIWPYPNDWSCCRCQLSIYIYSRRRRKLTVFLMQHCYILCHFTSFPDVVVGLIPPGDCCNTWAWKPGYRMEVQTVQRH